jgi:hypothetical protein
MLSLLCVCVCRSVSFFQFSRALREARARVNAPSTRVTNRSNTTPKENAVSGLSGAVLIPVTLAQLRIEAALEVFSDHFHQEGMRSRLPRFGLHRLLIQF